MRVLKENNSRRLDPKLRVIRNGDAKVNLVRSEISTTVASTVGAQKQLQDSVLEVVAAQESIATAPTPPGKEAAGKMKRRPKLKNQPKASTSYVNVFIELTPDRNLRPEQEIQAAAHAVTDLVSGKRADKPKGGGSPLSVAEPLRRRNMILATVPVNELARLEQMQGIAYIHKSEALKLDIPKGEAASGTPSPRRVGSKSLHKDGEGVIIGIIDVGGFDFAHPDFLDAKGETRFLSIWDQGGNFRPPPSGYGYGYGSELTGQHLKDAIRNAKKAKLPATELERQSQMSPGSHATHVTSIAAGNKGVCPRAAIAAVLIDIPPLADEREERRFTFSDSSRIVHAVEYLMSLAKREKKPIAINISLGTNGGAHDGTNGTSLWLDALLATPGRAICVAAGNAGQEKGETADDWGWIMGRIHTAGQIKQRGLEADLEWAVVGDGIGDVSENELEIWYGAQDRFTVSVQPPGSDAWITVEPRQYVENHRLSSGTTLSIYNELYHPANGSNYVAVYLSPNLDENDFRPIQSGLWRVRLKGDEIRDGKFHAWIERDDPFEVGRSAERRLFRFPSFFSQKSNVDSHSISSLACGRRVIAVANADSAQLKINISSSQGPTRDDRTKPEIAAPGTDIVAANGFSTSGDDWISMTGTSMASPYVTGVVGLMLATRQVLTAAQCAAILQRTSRPLPGTTYEWKNDSGFGLLDPELAVVEASTFNERVELRPKE